MINPSVFFKIASAKNTFEANHPKFAAFIRAIMAKGLKEGTVIEIKVTNPGEEPVETNLKVTQSDLDLIQSIKESARG